ncbi:MAG TPA: sulfur carrier protein ThiS [Nevskiaceae bacterium]|nr:sulfur carrier protein ThiS [Nevskiaceae bacterium]
MMIQLNGEALQTPARTVAELIEQLGLGGRRLAVEHNGLLLPKTLHPTTPLAAGDRLEIVQAIGGG